MAVSARTGLIGSRLAVVALVFASFVVDACETSRATPGPTPTASAVGLQSGIPGRIDASPGSASPDARVVALGTGTLAGRVIDSADKPVEGATIRISGKGMTTQSVRTEANGSFSVSEVTVPKVSLTVTKTGFVPARRTIGVATAGPTVVPVIAVAQLGAPAKIGPNGGVVSTSSGAAVLFPVGALVTTTSVSVTDVSSTPIVDSLPVFEDGLERTPVAAIHVSLGGAELRQPAVVKIPLPVALPAASLLELRSLDEKTFSWAPGVTYAAMSQDGRSALAVFDHFSAGVLFEHRSEKVGQAVWVEPRVIEKDREIASGDEDCRDPTVKIRNVSSPPATITRKIKVTGGGPGSEPGFGQTWTYDVHLDVVSFPFKVDVTGAGHWRLLGDLTLPRTRQRYRTEIEAISMDSAIDSKTHRIDWPDNDNGFVKDVIAQYGPFVLGKGYQLVLPVTVRRTDWQSAAKTIEYDLTVDEARPIWVTRTVTEPCSAQPSLELGALELAGTFNESASILPKPLVTHVKVVAVRHTGGGAVTVTVSGEVTQELDFPCGNVETARARRTYTYGEVQADSDASGGSYDPASGAFTMPFAPRVVESWELLGKYRDSRCTYLNDPNFWLAKTVELSVGPGTVSGEVTRYGQVRVRTSWTLEGSPVSGEFRGNGAFTPY